MRSIRTQASNSNEHYAEAGLRARPEALSGLLLHSSRTQICGFPFKLEATWLRLILEGERQRDRGPRLVDWGYNSIPIARSNQINYLQTVHDATAAPFGANCCLCGKAKDCLQTEIEGKEYDICSECWNPLAQKLRGKGRAIHRETVFLRPP